MKGGIILWLTYLMLLSELIFCESSFIEMRSFPNRNVRCNAGRLDRFDSLERIRLRSYRTPFPRKYSIENNVNGTFPVIDFMMIDQSRLHPIRLNKIYFKQHCRKIERVQHFRRGSRLNGENRRQFLPKSTHGMASNTAVITEVDSKELMFLKMSSNRIDGRINRGTGNRLSIRLRENRFRGDFGLKGSISSRRKDAERRVAKAGTGNRDASMQQNMRERDNSETRKLSDISRREHILTSMREDNKRYSARQRTDYFKGTHFDNKRFSRNFRKPNLFESTMESDSLNKLSKLRREKSSLTSRRELKIPEGQRIERENAKRIQRARSISHRDQNNALSILDRRNGRGFRGRMERRNTVERRVGIKISFLNQQIDFKKQEVQSERNQETVVAKIITRRSQMLLDSRIEKLTIRQHFENAEIPRFVPIQRNRKVSMITSYSKNRFNDLQRSREISKTIKHVRLSISSRDHSPVIGIKSPLTVRIGFNNERHSSQEGSEVMRQAVISNLNQKDVAFSAKVTRNRNRQRKRTLKASMRESSMEVGQSRKQSAFIENLGKTLTTSANDVLVFNSPSLYGDRHDTSQQYRRFSIRDERLSNQMQSISRSLKDSSKREIRNSNSRTQISSKSDEYLHHLSIKKHVNGRRIAVRRQRESHERQEVLQRNIRFDIIRIWRNKNNLLRINSNRMRDMRKQDRSSSNTRRITKNMYESNEFSEQPNRHDTIEHSASLRFKNRSGRHVDRSILKVKNIRVQTPISGMLVDKSLQLKEFKTNNRTEESLGVNSCFVPYQNKEVSKKIVPLKNLNRLRETRQSKKYEVINFPKSNSHTQGDSQTLAEYLIRKQNRMFSFVTNIILGLAVIAAMSDDTNKGLVSRSKNKLRNCIFRFVAV